MRTSCSTVRTRPPTTGWRPARSRTAHGASGSAPAFTPCWAGRSRRSHHARRCLELCESAPDEIEEFDLPFAYEAMARASAVAGNEEESREWLARARMAGERISDEDDRVLLESDLSTIGR